MGPPGAAPNGVDLHALRGLLVGQSLDHLPAMALGYRAHHDRECGGRRGVERWGGLCGGEAVSFVESPAGPRSRVPLDVRPGGVVALMLVIRSARPRAFGRLGEVVGEAVGDQGWLGAGELLLTMSARLCVIRVM